MRLPVGWAIARVDELAGPDGLVEDGDWVESKDQDPLGEVRLTQLADVGEGDFRDRSARFMNKETADRLRCTYLRPSDILIARMPDPIGRACYFPGVGQPAVTAVDVMIWRTDGRIAKAGWFVRWINSPTVRRAMMDGAGGTTRQRIAGGRIKELELPLPPLAEQSRIVTKLDALSARLIRVRAELARIPLLAERYQSVTLAAAFSGALTREWRRERIARSAVQPQDAHQISRERTLASSGQAPYPLPNTWRWARLAELTTKIGSGSTPRGGKGVYVSEGIPFIRSQNVYFEGFEKDGLVNITDDAARALNGVELFANDVLLNITGASIGRACIVPDALVGGRVSQHVAIIRSSAGLEPRFLLGFLRTPAIQNWIWNENYGVTRQALTKSMIENLEIPLPPLVEQAEIVRRIEAACARAYRLQAEAARAGALLHRLEGAILAKAFRGELVPQDAADEPAATLLARIRQSRETSPEPKRGRRARE